MMGFSSAWADTDLTGASVDNPILTDYVVNGTFDSSLDGWTTTTGAQNSARASNQQGDFSVPFWENWNPSSFTGKMYQTAEVPNGTYKLRIAAFVNVLGDEGTQYVYANSDKTNLTTGDPTFYTVFTYVSDGTIEFGLEQTVATANWMGIDNVSLYYLGSDNVVEEAKNAIDYTELNEAIADAEATYDEISANEPTYADEFNSIIAEIKDGISNKTIAADEIDSYIAKVEEAKLALYKSQSVAGSDMTDIITDAACKTLEGWNCTTGNTFHVNTWSGEGSSDGSQMLTPFIENWIASGSVLNDGKIYHDQVTGVNPGIYKLTVFVRAYNEAGGVDAITGVNFYANSKSVALADVLTASKSGSKMLLYGTVELLFRVTEDGTIDFGFDIASPTFNWIAFKNVTLSYQGTPSEAYEAALAAAQAVKQTDNMNADVLTALQDALSTYGSLTDATDAEYETAMDALNAATSAANTSIAAYASALEALNARVELLDKTNFFTEDAYETYMTKWMEKYNNNQLTDAEANALQNPNTITGWHNDIDVDDLLLSVWDAEAGAWSPYYINTWSLEGDNDGSGFHVPFFEYWTGDANSLGEKELTATMEGLEASATYDVSAWVRVRLKNDVTDAPTGITMQVGDGDAVDVCTGTITQDSYRLYLGEFTATGETDEEGTLTFKFTVSADNNISWLAFKNVWYELKSKTGIEAVKTSKIDGKVYNLNGQLVGNSLDKLNKGVYIYNGKKVIK